MATYYIDNTLTTGANSGAAGGDAYWSWMDMAFNAPSLAAGDIVEFVAGGNLYQEPCGTSFSSNLSTDWMTDLVISDSGNTWTSPATNFVTRGLTVADWVWLVGTNQDGLYKIGSITSGAGTNDIITMDADTPTLDDFTATTTSRGRIGKTGLNDSSCLMLEGSAGTDGNPIQIKLNGNTISGAKEIDSSYKWVDSGVNDEYYLVTTADGDPGFVSNGSIGTTRGHMIVDGQHYDYSSLDSRYPYITLGTVGGLIDKQWGYGDNNTLGFDTIYFRNIGGSPAQSFQVAATTNTLRLKTQNSFWDWDLGGGQVIGSEQSCFSVDVDAGAGVYQSRIRNGFLAYAGVQGVENVGSGIIKLENILTYWTGHRGWNQTSTVLGGGIITDHCSDYGSHLGARMVGSNTSIDMQNGIVSGNEAGGVHLVVNTVKVIKILILLGGRQLTQQTIQLVKPQQ